VEAAEAAAVIGRYQVAAIGTTFVVELDGGKLFAHGEGGARRVQLLRQDDSSCLVPERGLRIEFERDGGRATKFRLVQAGMTFEGQRVP
jgi:hypothetical protein